MPYNMFGYLEKHEVLEKLQDMGCDIRSMHVFNKILEEMGILKDNGGSWLTTHTGARFSLGNNITLNEKAWHPSLVQEVYSFCRKTGRMK